MPVHHPLVERDLEVFGEFRCFLGGESHSETEYGRVPLGRGMREVSPREFT